MSFDYQKSIDFLLENGRDVIQYRLHKDILHDLTEAEEKLLLEKVMQTPEYQLLLTHVKPNGYIGTGMHSWEKFKALSLGLIPTMRLFGSSIKKIFCRIL